jgi:transposase
MFEVIHPQCCGLDVHKKSVTAHVLTPERAYTRTFRTMLTDLEALADWLAELGVTLVAMESTGVYWQPVYNVLELRAGLTIWVVNAQHIKKVPGRKTDVSDAQWLAQLARHGLVRPSFIPDRPTRELRELVRYRTALVRQRSEAVNRIHKVLEGANLKLGAVATDILGVSGRAMLEALAAGETDARVLAELARGRLRAKLPDLRAALRGTLGDHQRMMLRSLLRHIDDLNAQLAELSAEVERRLAPHAEAIARLDTIPGVGQTTAEVLVSELGTDMTRFPTAAHAASWAGLCPGQNESGGKRRSGRTRRGSPYLRTALVEAAQAASRARGTALAARYHQLAPRRGPKRAAVAVAHRILVIAYHLLCDGGVYAERHPAVTDPQAKQRTVRRAIRQLINHGYTVTLIPEPPPAAQAVG